MPSRHLASGSSRRRVRDRPPLGSADDAGSYRGALLNGERALLDRLRALLPVAPAGQVWIGDDAAVLPGGRLLAADAVVEGVHFDLAWSTPSDAGWKAMAVNVSDLAAMGGGPDAAVLTLVVPPARPGLADEVLAGAAEAADALGCPLVGGDTTTGTQLVISVAVLGSAGDDGAVLRSGARPGDAILVTAPIGGARAALAALRRGARPDPAEERRLRRPQPRLAEGRAAAAAGATAMIDLSDGLSTDLGHVADASGVGFVVRAASVPVGSGASIADALHGGDEYELCFTGPDPARLVDAFVAAGLPEPVQIGDITEGPDRQTVGADGGTTPLEPGGWEHPVA